jgi:hypothetical protein
MPLYNYTGEDVRNYIVAGLHAEPGCDPVERDENPDPVRFVEVVPDEKPKDK